jgi:hypothetical protein
MGYFFAIARIFLIPSFFWAYQSLKQEYFFWGYWLTAYKIDMLIYQLEFNEDFVFFSGIMNN